MQTKEEISEGLGSIWNQVQEFCSKIHKDVAHTVVIDGKWTISKELDHLILSSKPIEKMLGAGARVIRELPVEKKAPENYDQLYARYHETLRSTVVNAPGRFRTDDEENSVWKDQLKLWVSTGSKIEKGLKRWSEPDLDEAQVKHPVLGQLWVREMLFFTHIHTSHHLKSLIEKARIVSAL